MENNIGPFATNRNVQLFVFQSSLKSIDALEVLLKRLRRQLRLPDNTYSSIWIAVNEALSNAIIHGNRFDLNKKVRMLVQFKKDQWVCFTVQDEGQGFDHESLEDEARTKQSKPYGSGVKFMKKLADGAFYSEKGTTVDLYFDIKPRSY